MSLCVALLVKDGTKQDVGKGRKGKVKEQLTKQHIEPIPQCPVKMHRERRLYVEKKNQFTVKGGKEAHVRKKTPNAQEKRKKEDK